jgi:hypothetical protein
MAILLKIAALANNTVEITNFQEINSQISRINIGQIRTSLLKDAMLQPWNIYLDFTNCWVCCSVFVYYTHAL